MTAPVLQQTTPLDNATGVAVTANLTLTFDQIVKLGSSGSIRIYESDGTLAQTISITDASQVSLEIGRRPMKVIINPNVDLDPAKSYYVLVDSGAVENSSGEDFAGISSPTTFNFSTVGAPPGGDTTAPTLTNTSPLDNATGVAVSANLVLTFNESVQAGSGNIEIHKTSDNSIVKTIAVIDGTQVSFSGSQLTINPNIDLQPGTGYYVTMSTGAVRDLADNNFAGISSSTVFNFTTSGSAPSDTTAPHLTGTTPLDDATGVAVGTNIVLTFDEAVQAGAGNIVIRNAIDGTVARFISVADATQVSFSGNQVTINPTTDLAENHAYYVTMSMGVVRDLSNNNFAGISGSTTFNFTTAGTADTTAPQLTGTSPLDNAFDVAPNANFVFTFNEAVKAGTGSILFKSTFDNSVVYSFDVTDTSQVSFSGNEMTINPTVDLAPNGYYVTMANGVVKDLAGNNSAGISAPTAFNFFVPEADVTPPALMSVSPLDDALDVDVGTDIVLYFDEAVKAGSGNIEIHSAVDDSLVQSISVTDASQVNFTFNEVRIDPSVDLDHNKAYYVTFGAGVILDTEDNSFAGISSPTELNFSTARFLVLGDQNSNALIGSDDDDTLDGGMALDTLAGGLGDDTYIISNREGGETSVVLQVENTAWPGWFPTGRTLSLPFAESELPTTVYDKDIIATALDSSGDGIVDGIHFQYHSAIDWWDLIFDTYSIGTALLPGTYLDATAEFSAGHPFLIVEGNSGASLPFGSFTVTEAVFDYSGLVPVIVSLSISFELHTASPDGTVMYGVANYSYAPAGAATTDLISEALGGGIDTVRAAVSYVLPDNVENLILIGPYDIDGTGNALANVITGSAADNVLDGAAGADTMAGGEGDDTYVIDDPGDSVVENPNEGDDTVESSITDTLDPNVENLVLTGSANLNGTGNELNNILIGNSGTNVLTGLGGDDYYVLGAGDTPSEAANGGIDTVQVAATYTLSDNLENLILNGAGNIDGAGNSLANVLTGSRQLPTTLGQNVLTGDGGNDTLDGGTGVDTLIGGDGDDTYVIGNYEGGETSLLVLYQPNDNGLTGYAAPLKLWSYVPDPDEITTQVVDLTDGGLVSYVRIHINSDGGFWTLDFSTEELGVELAPGVYEHAERASFASDGHPGLDVSGNGAGYSDDEASFTIANVVFDYSGPGDPVLISLSVSFEMHFDNPNFSITGVFNYNYAPAGPAMLDTIVEDVGGGTDTVQSAIDYVLTAPNVENLKLIGTAEVNGTGNAGNNVITGNDADNVLDGGAGADTMIGGDGNDTFIVDSPGDVVVEEAPIFGSGGNDEVRSSISYVLGIRLEHLTLTGSANINATGNADGNDLTGNSGNNVLSGGLGYDQLTGGGGNDTFNIVVDPGMPKFISDFSAGAGIGDVVVLDGFALSSFSAVQAAMSLDLYGTSTILNLGDGQTLTFWNVLPGAFSANDFSFINVPAPPGPLPFTLPVSGAFTNTITGGRRADTLTGNSANNRLDGGQGNDTMTGLAGDDTYLVDSSGDKVMESSGQGIDTVMSSASSYALANNVENLTLTGTSNHTATGNGLDNLIIASNRPDTINGGAGNDIIRAGTGAGVHTGGAGNDIFEFSAIGSKNKILDFHDGEDLVDLRPLFSSYAGSDPLADGSIVLSSVAGSVLISVKANGVGTLRQLVELSGVSVGDLDVGSDILWS